MFGPSRALSLPMPPACPVECYVPRYNNALHPRFTRFSSDGVAVAGEPGEQNEETGNSLCSQKRDAPPGKPVASGLPNAGPFPSKCELQNLCFGLVSLRLVL